LTGHAALSAALPHDAFVTHAPVVVLQTVPAVVHSPSLVHGVHWSFVHGLPAQSLGERHELGVQTPLRHSVPAP
jgi:hypothetical protein